MRVAWVPTATNIDRASFRLQTWYNHLWLLRNGVESCVVPYEEYMRDPEALAKRADILVWFRADQPRDAFRAGLPVVMFVSDGPMPAKEWLAKATRIVTDSPWVAENRVPEPLRDLVVVIPVTAAGDVPPELRAFQEREPSDRLVWVGTHQNYLWAKPILDHLARFWPVEVIGAGDIATTQWSLESVAADIRRCSIGVVPMAENLEFGDTHGFLPMAKDPDRLTLLQACGVPVLASPIPSWKSYIRDGMTGIICADRFGFEGAVRFLLGDPKRATAIAMKGHAQAWGFASEEATGKKWLGVLSS